MRISDWSSDVCSSDLSTRRGARCALAAATAWAALMAAPASAQSDIPLQPFPVNHELRIDSGADARLLLDGPAGKYGCIGARSAHLYSPDGTRFSGGGLNMNGRGGIARPTGGERGGRSGEISVVGRSRKNKTT